MPSTTQILTWGGIGLAIWLVLSLLKRREADANKRRYAQYDAERYTEENVRRVQIDFEDRLDKYPDLPDAITGRDAYIYRNLMSVWFSHLIAKQRYVESMAKELRADWLGYMSLLEGSCTSSFLSAEAKSDADREKYGKQYDEERRELEAIENAFAAQIGQEAITILTEVRLRRYDAFDRAGKNLAPDGFHYFPTSFRPYMDSLVPDNKNSSLV